MKVDVPKIKSSALFKFDDMCFDECVNNRCFLYSVRTFDHWEKYGMQNWWDHPKYQLKNHPHNIHLITIK